MRFKEYFYINENEYSVITSIEKFDSRATKKLQELFYVATTYTETIEDRLDRYEEKETLSEKDEEVQDQLESVKEAFTNLLSILNEFGIISGFTFKIPKHLGRIPDLLEGYKNYFTELTNGIQTKLWPDRKTGEADSMETLFKKIDETKKQTYEVVKRVHELIKANGFIIKNEGKKRYSYDPIWELEIAKASDPYKTKRFYTTIRQANARMFSPENSLRAWTAKKETYEEALAFLGGEKPKEEMGTPDDNLVNVLMELTNTLEEIQSFW